MADIILSAVQVDYSVILFVVTAIKHRNFFMDRCCMINKNVAPPEEMLHGNYPFSITTT